MKFLLGASLLLPFALLAQPNGENVRYSMILVGDAGEHKPFTQKVMDKALDLAADAGEDAAMIFLGDNIYPLGLPRQGDPERASMESKLTPQLAPLRDMEGKGFIIPGNHDWAKGKEEGLQNVYEQQEFADSFTGKQVFYPRDGCPGPVDFQLTDDILLIILDSQWLLVEADNRDFNSCSANTVEEVTSQVGKLINDNPDKIILVTAHHPIITYGSHGGVFQFKQHLFPLTDIKKGLWIPLPVIGSIYPLYRKWFGNIQDTTNKKNKEIMDQLVTHFENHPRVIHAAGHEHALEHMQRNGVEYVVSGSGAKTEFVKQKGYAQYATGKNGLATLSYLDNDQLWLSFWVFDEENPEGTRLYQEQLFTDSGQ